MAPRRHNFTVLELIIVLMIGALLTGLVVSRVGKLPAFASLDRNANDVEKLLSYAAYLALLRGSETRVTIKPESRTFNIAVVKTQEEQDSDDMGQQQSSLLANKYMKLTLPNSIKISVPSADIEGTSTCYFYPDGTASGPGFYMTLGKHAVKMWISPLTGMIMKSEASINDVQ